MFPGSLIGYFLYGNLGKQPDFISNPIGTSINHLVFFFYLSILGFIFRSNQRKFINSFSFLFLISIILELLHYFIPNRAFEINDLYANISGVLLAYLIFKLFNVKNIRDFNSKISLIKKEAQLKDNLKALNIDIKKNSEKIIKGINLLRLGNNPIKLTDKDIINIIENENVV